MELSCICRTAIERYEENCAASVSGTSGTRERKSLRVPCAPQEYRAEIQAASESCIRGPLARRGGRGHVKLGEGVVCNRN